MAHRRNITRSSLPITLASRSRSLMSNALSLPAFTYSLLAIGKSCKPKLHRAMFLAFFSLIAISTYIFIVRPPLLHAHITLRADSGNNGKRIPADGLPRLRAYRFPQHRKTVVLPQIQLDESQELAAVTSFMASLPQNVIPSYVDPSRPIDPQLVLDFDTRSSRAADEMRVIVEDVWTRNPVVLFSKVCVYSLSCNCRLRFIDYCVQLHSSRSLKTMLAGLYLSPPPTIFDVDQRG